MLERSLYWVPLLISPVRNQTGLFSNEIKLGRKLNFRIRSPLVQFFLLASGGNNELISQSKEFEFSIFEN